MQARFDFSSRTTGRAWLQSMFDTPSDGFSAKLALKIRRKLSKTARELENMIAEELGKTTSVRLTLDGYESSVFWYLVLFRPFYVERDPVLGPTAWNVYELMQDPSKRHILKRLNWGAFWDEERNWLVLLWEEALNGGVLDKLRECPSWDQILKKEEKRLGTRLDWQWWKKCAESSPHVVPEWKLKDLSYMRGQLWHRPGAKYSDITVLNAAGIEVPKFQVGRKVSAVLPAKKQAHFAHHYVEEDEKRTYMASIVQFEKRDLKEKRRKARGMSDALVNERRNRRRRKKRERITQVPGGQVARALTQVTSALGKSYRRGRPPKQMRPEEMERRFESAVDAYLNGDYAQPNWHAVERHLDSLEEILKDNPDLPDLRIARRWLLWRNEGRPGIHAFVEHRRGNLGVYREILKSQPFAKRRELQELIELLCVEKEEDP
jgi:hypothetical protein